MPGGVSCPIYCARMARTLSSSRYRAAHVVYKLVLLDRVEGLIHPRNWSRIEDPKIGIYTPTGRPHQRNVWRGITITTRSPHIGKHLSAILISVVASMYMSARERTPTSSPTLTDLIPLDIRQNQWYQKKIAYSHCSLWQDLREHSK